MERHANFLVKLPIPVIVDSYGGNADSAYRISKLIFMNKKNLVVLNDCLSACAEYFIPSAKHVTVSQKSLIGYHVGDFMNDTYGTEQEIENDCNFQRISWLRRLYTARNLNQEFYKQTQVRLGLKAVFIKRDFKKKCTTLFFTYEKSMWFPTSDQLNKFLNLKLSKRICADNVKCWKSNIDSWAPEGAYYVVGDRVYREPLELK